MTVRRKPRRKVARSKMNPYAETIYRDVTVAKRPLSTRRVAMRTRTTWTTAKKYLSRLERKGKIEKSVSGNRTYWASSKKKLKKRR